LLAFVAYPLIPWKEFKSVVLEATPPNKALPVVGTPEPDEFQADVKVAAVANAVIEPVTDRETFPPTLDQLLENANCGSESAFASMLQRWGNNYVAQDGRTPCEAAAEHGLQCLHDTGTWNKLRYYNRPALLDMRDSNGQPHLVLLNQMSAGEVSLQCDDIEMRFPIAEADRHWLGDYLLLWKPPGNRIQLQQGNRGAHVAALQQRLAQVNQHTGSEPIVVNAVFDDTLRQQVIAFQLEHGLMPDGIAGKETLILLNSLSGDSSVPTLQQTTQTGDQ
jgi:general secretion pathway protein A